MANVVYSCGGVELREMGGETFSTIVRDGLLTVKRDGSGVSIDVAGNTVAWVTSAPNGPFKRVDTRSFMMSTTDLMSCYYITLPRGLPETKYEHFNDVLTALKEGQPMPAEPAAGAAAAAAAPAAAAVAAAEAPSAPAAAAEGAAKPAGGNPFGDMMAAIAQKAAHDTMALGDMIRKKAEHDMQSMQEQQHKTA